MEPATRMLGGRYELLELLATGGMGQVWRARDALLHRPVAVKVLRSELTGDPTFLARFRAEAQHTAVLTHRNIATLYDYGEAPPENPRQEHLAYLVMELVEGEPLSALLAREGRLDVPRTLDVLRQTAAALAAAHDAGVVHRDVKPGNVLVGTDGVVKISDFGIAWSASSVPLTQTGQVVGTAHYLSPEQAAGGKAGPASDVYALGAIGYECLTGRRAFDGENSVQIALSQLRDVPAPLPDDVPENVRRLIDRAMVKDPAERFADGAAFRDAVDQVLAGRTLPPVPPATAPFLLPFSGAATPPPRSRRRRALAPLVALAAGVGIGGAALHMLGAASDPTAVAAADTGAPSGIVLAADTYVGRPVAEVEAALGRLGLQVALRAQQTAGAAPGTVTGLTPTGAVSPGAAITVFYAVAPAAAPTTAERPPARPTTVTTSRVTVVVTSPPADPTKRGGGAHPRSGSGSGNGHDRHADKGGRDRGKD